MATVKVRTGAVSAMDDPESLPVEKWDQLVRARYRYLAVNLPSDCSCLLQFVHEAERLRMWEKVEHVDMTTGDRRPYKDMNDFICNAFELDPEKVQWAIDGFELLKPNENLPYDVAAYAGRKKERIIAALNENPELSKQEIADKTGSSRRYVREIGAKLAEKAEPKLLNKGDNQHSGSNNGNTLPMRGNSRAYTIALLEREGFSDLADQVRTNKKSATAAKEDAGFKKSPESQLTILKRAWKKASEVDRQSFKLFIEEK